MGTKDYLYLREVRLGRAERWTGSGQGLWFLFPKQGSGEFADGRMRQRFSPGDAFVVNVISEPSVAPVASSELVFRCLGVALERLYPLLAANEIPLTHLLAEKFKRGRIYPAKDRAALQCRALLERVPPEANLEHHTLLLQVLEVLVTSKWPPEGRVGGDRRWGSSMPGGFSNGSQRRQLSAHPSANWPGNSNEGGAI